MADGRLLFDTKINTSGFMNGLKGLGSLATKAMGFIGKSIMAVSGGLAVFGASAIKTGMEFEAQMSRVQAISGATGEELKGLNALAIKLGADTAFSAKEAADGMENLASAGFSTKEIMAAMPGLLDLAAVSGGDVAQASEVAASALRAFGLEASQAGHVADVFAKAAADTNAEVGDMGEAMKYVAPVAKAMGQSIEETAAAIGIMSDAGVKGSQAGTTLRGAFSRLAKPTKAMREVMEELSLSFYDAQGNMKPLNGIISDLKKNTSGLTQEQKNQALVTLFGQESLSGMLALIEAGPEKLNALTDSLKNSDGAAKEMAQTMQKNVKNNIEQMMGSLDTLKIKLFQSVSEPLSEVTNKATEYLNKMGDAFSGVDEKTKAAMDKMGLSFEEAGISAAQAKGGLEGLVMVLGDGLAEALNGMVSALPKLVGIGVQVVQTLANSIISNLPQIGNSLASLATILIQGIVTILPQLLVAGIQIVTSIAQGLASSLPTLIPIVNQGIMSISNALIAATPTLVPAVISILTSLGQMIVQNLPLLLNAALQIILGLSQGIIAALPTLIPQVIQILLSIVSFITQNIGLIINGAVQIIIGLVNGLIQALPQLIPAVLQMIVAICDALIQNLPLLIDAALQLIMALAQGLIDNLPYLIEQVPRIINSFTDALMGKLPDLIMMGLKLIVALGEGLIKAIPTLIANIPQIIMAIINAFTLASFWSLGKNLIANIGKGITNMKGSIGTTAKNLATNVNEAIKSIFSEGLNIGKNLISKIGNGVSSMIGELSSIARNMANNAINAAKGIFSGAADIGSNLVKGIWNGIHDMTGWIKNNILAFARGITSSIKSFFGIHSPSRVMRDEVGKWLPPGIAVGFDKGMPGLEKDINSQLNGLTDTMKRTVEAESSLTAGKIAANSNVYLPSPFDRKQLTDGSTAMVVGDIKVISQIDGRVAGYSTAKYSSEEQALESKRRQY